MRSFENYETRNDHGASFFTGLLCGAAAGAALGLVLAPKPGSELRQQLADSTGTLRQKAADTGRAVRSRLSKGANEVATQAGSLADVASQRATEALNHVAEAGRSTIDRMTVR